MIVTNTAREKNTVTFDVTLDAAEFEKYINAAYKKNKGKIMVAGFRKGHAPRMVIEGMYGKEVFHEDAINDAAPVAFGYAVTEEKLDVVGRPAIEKVDVTEEGALVLSFQSDVWPQVELGEYKGLEAEKTPVEVTDAQVDDEVAKLRKQNGRLETVEREAANGDTVNIDFVGSVDGVPFEGGAAEGHNLVLGSGSFVPGFEEQLVGIKAGEERDINVHFPENYSAPLADKDSVFHVKCNEVKEEQLPEVDDEFAKDNDYDTVAEMREDIRTRMVDGLTTTAENAYEDALIEKAAAGMSVEIPESMIEEQMDENMQQYAQYMSNQGMKLEEYLQMIGSDYNTFRASSKPTAEKQVRTEILLKAVAQAEKLEITDEDVENEFAAMAEKYKQKVENVKKVVNVEQLKEQLLHDKAMRVIVDSGVAVEPKKEAEAE